MHSGIWTRYADQVEAGLAIDHGIDPVAHLALGIAGEAGEVADLVKKGQYRGGVLDRVALIEELGDLFWYITAMMRRFALTPADLIVYNVAKLAQRRPYAGYDLEAVLGGEALTAYQAALVKMFAGRAA